MLYKRSRCEAGLGRGGAEPVGWDVHMSEVVMESEVVPNDQ